MRFAGNGTVTVAPCGVAVADVDALADADLLSDAEAEGVVEALALALALGVGLSDGEAVALDDSSPVPPRMTGAPASAASDPPHPASSITAHAMTAPAAFPLPELEPNAPKRRMRALIVGRASPGLCPIIVHVSVTIGHGRSEHNRVNTFHFNGFCPGMG